MTDLLPESASSYAPALDGLTLLITVITGAAFLLLAAVLSYSVLRFRARAGVKAVYLAGTTWREMRWVLVPVGVVLLLDLWIDVRTHEVWVEIKQDIPAPEYSVRVTGQQYSWMFTHPGTDGLLDTADDVKRVNELHVPVDTTVGFELEARDVIHGFFVPALRYKQDAVPGRTARGWFKATKAGRYEISCSEICGVGHTAMGAWLIVHEKKDFAPELPTAAPLAAGTPVERGAALVRQKGCITCHSLDGSKLAGPTYQGLWQKHERVVTGGQERDLVVDEDYLRRSLIDPTADVVVGYPPVMPPQAGVLTDAELDDLIAFLKTL